jgi:trigger factor
MRAGSSPAFPTVSVNPAPANEDELPLNVQVVKLPQSQVSLDIEVDSAAIGNAIDRAYQRLSQRVNVPGFRKGKVPRAVLEAAVGRTAVLKEAADSAVDDAYRWALKQTGLEPLTPPEIELQGEGFDPSRPLYFTAKFYVRPSVQLGDYRSIRVAAPKTAIDDEAVERVIRRMAEKEAPWEPVEDRPAAAGDLALLKLRGTVDDETVVDQDREEYYLDPEQPIDSGVPNLTPHIVGMSVGETRDFALTLSEKFQPEQYAGKTLQCHVEVLRLEHKAPPVVDDAFAQAVGDYETLEALRARVRASLEAQQRVEDADAFVAAVLRRAVDAATAEVPPPMVEDEVNHTIAEIKAEVESRREMTFDLYLRLIDKTEDDLRAEARGPAEARVKGNLVLEAIADAEGLTPPGQQVDAELRAAAALPAVRERDRRRILASPGARARVEARFKRGLALQRLLEIANPRADSADKDTKDTDKGASDQRALREAVPSHANALSSVEQHPGEEES